MEKVRLLVHRKIWPQILFVVSVTDEAACGRSLMLKTAKTLPKRSEDDPNACFKKAFPTLKPKNITSSSQLNYYDSTETRSRLRDTDRPQQLTAHRRTFVQSGAARSGPAVGKGNVAVAVNLDLNFDKQTVDKVEFSPPVDGELLGLPRSSEETYSGSGTADGAGGVAGTNPNGTGTPAYVAETEEPSGAAESSYTKIYNYELNEIRTKIEKAQGTPQNLSVAVLINANVEDAAGYADSYKNLTAKAIGVKPDYISVEIMPFVDRNDGRNSAGSIRKPCSS